MQRAARSRASEWEVELVSVDGAVVDLRPVAYQFPGTTGAGPDDWDADWLVVAG